MIDVINLVCLAVMFACLVKAFSVTPYRWLLTAFYLVLAVFVLAMAQVRSRFVDRPWQPLLSLIAPIVFLCCIFESFFMLLPYFNTARYDAQLVAIDHALFGVHPTVWIERFIHPGLTDLLSICYLVYFPLPFVPLWYYFRMRRFVGLERAAVAFLLCYYGGYIMYFCFPAEGPRFYIAHLQTVPLAGSFVTHSISALIAFFEPNRFDAFPSLHAGVVTTTMIVTWGASRRIFLLLLPLAIGIMISLVYGRYHYVIDVIVGVVWSAISYALGVFLYDWSRARSRLCPHFGAAARDAA